MRVGGYVRCISRTLSSISQRTCARSRLHQLELDARTLEKVPNECFKSLLCLYNHTKQFTLMVSLDNIRRPSRGSSQ